MNTPTYAVVTGAAVEAALWFGAARYAQRRGVFTMLRSFVAPIVAGLSGAAVAIVGCVAFVSYAAH